MYTILRHGRLTRLIRIHWVPLQKDQGLVLVAEVLMIIIMMVIMVMKMMMIIDDLPNDDTMMIFDQEVRLILTTKRLVTTSCPSEKTVRVNFLVSFSLLSE